MDYQYFRLSLSENRAPPLLEFSGISQARSTRTEFLVDLFAQTQLFPHRKKLFKYIKFGEVGPVIYGAIGKPSAANLKDESFLPDNAEGYVTANIFLDTRGDKEGQKLVIQAQSKIGIPAAILTSFIDHLNDSAPKDQWRLSIFPMGNEVDFWEAEQKHRGEITKVQFRFAVPNMLGSIDNLSDELRDMGGETKAQEVDLVLSRRDGGLSLSNDMVRNAWNYVSQGCGKAIIQVGKKVVYNSTKRILKREVKHDIDVSTSSGDEVQVLAERIFDR